MLHSGESAPCGGLIVADARGRVLFCTEDLAARLGCASAEVAGRPVSELLPAVESALPGTWLDGGRVELRSVPMGDGGCCAQLCTLRQDPAAGSMTEGGLPPEALSHVARLTHDLNNVFSVIYAAIDMALDPEFSVADVHNSLADAQKSARHGAQIVTSIRQMIGRELGAAAPGGASAGTGTALASGDAHERILVVSAHGATRLHLRAVLAYRGYEVIEAASMDAARERLGVPPPVQLLIGDHDTAPGAEWQALGRTATPVLVLSAEAAREEAAVPAVNWLAKPFENAALAARVRALLNARRQE